VCCVVRVMCKTKSVSIVLCRASHVQNKSVSIVLCRANHVQNKSVSIVLCRASHVQNKSVSNGCVVLCRVVRIVGKKTKSVSTGLLSVQSKRSSKSHWLVKESFA
jgi:hypothetical protein